MQTVVLQQVDRVDCKRCGTCACMYVQRWGWESNIATKWGTSGVFIGPAIWQRLTYIFKSLGINMRLCTVTNSCTWALNRSDANAGGMTERSNLLQTTPRLETLYIFSILQRYEVQPRLYLLPHNINRGNTEHVNSFINFENIGVAILFLETRTRDLSIFSRFSS